MRKLIMALSAASIVASGLAIPTSADARQRYGYREWKGRDGRVYCRKSNGTTGLVVGGVTGAIVGRSIAGRGDKGVGTILGGVAGAFGGQAIDKANTRSRRCR